MFYLKYYVLRRFSHVVRFVNSPTAERYGVFAHYRFQCALGELGPFREGTGFREQVPVPCSGNRVRVSMGSDRFCGSNVPGSEGCVPEVSKVSVFDGFRQFRFCSRGLDGTGSGNRVLGTRGIKKVPGPFPRFRKLLCILKEHFCTLKVYV